MTGANAPLLAALEADKLRRAEAARATAATPREEYSHSQPLRFRLVNDFPRETRPVLARLRAALAPYGYTLSPLHPPHDLSIPRMQTDLARLSPDDATRFAPLVFELDSPAETLRVYVRQFGGRAAPDFAERRLRFSGPVDLAGVEAALADYVIRMLETHGIGTN